MLVDIPVSIIFDCESLERISRHAPELRVFTMRYDTTDTDVAAQWTDHYPPRQNAHFITDEQGVLFDLLTSGVDRAIRRQAELDPETYSAKVHA